MTNNQKILLGISAVALGYWLYKRKVDGISRQAPITPKLEEDKDCPNGQELIQPNCFKAPCEKICADIPKSEPRSFNCQSGKPFSLKDNITNGVIPNLTGVTTQQVKQNVLFKKGDLVCGDVITKFILNKNMKGILAKPTVKGAYSETTMQFIPIEYLTPLSLS